MSDVAWSALTFCVTMLGFFGWLAWSDWLDSKRRSDDDD